MLPLSRAVLRSTSVVALIAATAIAWRPATPAAQPVEIAGAGATFPYPIYSAWFAEYAKTRSDFRVTYQSIGSGAGIRQLTDLFVFFGATDTPMTEDELLAAPRRIVHLPTVVGAVAPVYNIPGVATELKFSGPLLADIFLGKITNWNDPAIARLNAGIALPPVEITPVYRAESSGTSLIWSDFLSKTSTDWRRLVGATRVIKIPTGVSARGSEGVSALVKQTAGAIGYVEVIYAKRNAIALGQVQNAAGEFVSPVDCRHRRGRRRRGRQDAKRPARVDHQCARHGRLSDLVVHVDSLVRKPGRPRAQPTDGGLPSLGAQRGPAARAGSRVCAAAGRDRQDDDRAPESRQSVLSGQHGDRLRRRLPDQDSARVRAHRLRSTHRRRPGRGARALQRTSGRGHRRFRRHRGRCPQYCGGRRWRRRGASSAHR